MVPIQAFVTLYMRIRGKHLLYYVDFKALYNLSILIEMKTVSRYKKSTAL